MKATFFIGMVLVAAWSSDLILSPALTDNALAVTQNPAGLGTYRKANLGLNVPIHSESLMVAGASIRGFGIGLRMMENHNSFYLANGIRIRDGFYLGMRTGYVDTPLEDFYNYDMGLILRPSNFLSLGVCTDNFIHGGVSSETLVKLGAGLKVLDYLVINGDVDYDGEFTRPRIGAEIMLGGLNIIGTADLTGYHYGLGVSLSLANIESGFLYPFEKSDEKRISFWTGLDRKPAFIEMPKRVAVIKMDGTIHDLFPEFSLFGNFNVMVLTKILAQLRYAAQDSDVGTVIIKIGNISSGLGMVEEVREAIFDLRISGKKVICYLDNVEILEYYLACAADEIVVEPVGSWIVAGVRAEITFLKGTMDKIGIKAEFERMGEYKSAIEPFTRDSISAEFKENETALLLSIYERLVDGITSARDLERELVVETLDKGTISLKEAVELGFIDKTGYFSELVAEYDKKEKSISLVNRTYYGHDWKKEKSIAVVHASGTIIPGESFTDFLTGELFMGSETLVRILKKLRKNKKIKAVVLRINSGGGSAVASDIIWHEVEMLRKAGKPVIVSIGNIAASGGYYFACNADTIVCNEGAIVGSIGVWTGKFVFRGLYDKIGLRKEIIKFGKNADAFSDYKEFTEDQRKKLRKGLEDFYDEFVARVAVGRNMSMEAVDSVGRGRVFTGIQAKENGLVDVLGGIAEAIDIAKFKAGFSEMEMPGIEVYPKRRGFFATMFEDEEAKASRSFVRAIRALNSHHILAIMPYRINIQ